MGTLEKVMEMQSQGISDSEIIKKLKDEGVSPKEINDSLNQAKIKEAVSEQPQEVQPGMEQSIMEPQEQQYAPQEQQYTDQQYYQPQAQQLDTDTITEIAEQVVSSKFAEFKEKTGDLVSFKFTTQEKIADFDERLKRIEAMLDKIQSAIVGKFSETTGNMGLIHKDLDNLHSTVSSLMNPLVDNYRELRKLAGKE